MFQQDLYVEVVEPPAVVCHQLYALVRHHLTAAHAQLAQAGTVAPQLAQPQVRHVTLANVQGAEAGAWGADQLHPRVANALAAAQVQVSEKQWGKIE